MDNAVNTVYQETKQIDFIVLFLQFFYSSEMF